MFSLFAGVVVDRLEARRTVIGTQIGHMVLATAMATITLAGVVEAWHVYVIAFLAGTVQVLDAPARQQLTYRMVGRGELLDRRRALPAAPVPEPVAEGDEEPQRGEQRGQAGRQQRGPGAKHEARRQVDRADQRQQQQDQASDGVPVPGLDQLGFEPLPEDGAVVAHRADQQSR